MLSRQYTLEKYAELLGLPKEDTICINLEKSTYNSTIRKTNELGDVPASRESVLRKPIQTYIFKN